MIDDLLALFEDPALRAAVRAAASAPVPALVDPGELAESAPVERAALAIGVLAAASPALSAALPVMLSYLQPRLQALTQAERGRFWHLSGVAASRRRDFLQGTLAFNRALGLVSAAYLPRVHDSLGRLLQAWGLVDEARAEFLTALELREAQRDEQGLALTLGNLGRLELESGNWLAARDAFQRDHDIVLRRSPEELRLRAQLLTHLGECERGLGNPRGAQAYFERARHAAGEAGDRFGHCTASIELARAMVALALPGASALLEETARAVLAVEPSRQPALLRLLELARAELFAEDGRVLDAEAAFARALEAAALSTLVTPVEHAMVARAAARFQTGQLGGGRAVEYLQRALRLLDGTGAALLRAEVESELRHASNDAWTLHVVGRFIGRSAVELALREAGQAGFRGERRELAVLFADLRGFTSAAERLSAQELVGALNHFLSRMAACVEEAGGVVDKFVGDAVMALFGLDGDSHRAAASAVRAALLMQAELERLNRRGGLLGELQMGVGIHLGPVVLGLVGSPQHRSYTALGAAVNLASRLEGMTRPLGASVLISAPLAAALPPGRFALRPLGRYAPKGAAEPVACFDVMGEQGDADVAARFSAEISLCEAAQSLGAQPGESAALRQVLEQLCALARGSPREAGYRLRLSHLGAPDGVIRLSEK